MKICLSLSFGCTRSTRQSAPGVREGRLRPLAPGQSSHIQNYFMKMKTFVAIFFMISAVEAVHRDCAGKTSVIRNGKEYRMFFEHRTSEQAVKACKQWGKEWKSETMTTNLIKDIDEELQQCLKVMIRDQLLLKSEETIGYFIGGETENTTKDNNRNTTGWHWKSGKPIATTKEGGFQKWAADQPRHKGPTVQQKRCMSAIIQDNNGSEPGDWVDENCTNLLRYICQREIPDDLLWGYRNNPHAIGPDEWGKFEKKNEDEWGRCEHGARQSPVNIDLRNLTKCGNDELNTAVEWGSNEPVEWIVKNTGRTVEIKISPHKSLYTTFEGSDKKYYVDYIHLKWGADSTSGSEHTIAGQRHAGEFQIFHHSHDGEERHALAFMIHQRTFGPNLKWNKLLNSIQNSQAVKTDSTIPSPKGHILALLEDSTSIRNYNTPSYITGLGFRYKGSLTHPPCTENITWTVYPRPIDLSFSQFRLLRTLHLEGKEDQGYRFMTENARPLQNRECSSCFIKK